MQFLKARSMYILLVISLTILLTGGITGEATAKEYKIRIASHMASSDPTGIACVRLGALLDKKSKGRIKASVHNDAELGKQREVVEMVRDGGVEITTSGPGAGSAYVIELALLDLPYLYDDSAHYLRVLKALRPDFEKLLAPYNIKPLGAMVIGFRHMLNKKRPIYKVSDLKGLKMRAPIPMYLQMFNALGADGTTVTWSEVYTALQSGVVDGMEASPALIYAMKFHEQAKYLSKTYHIASSFYFFTCKNWFDSLPKDLQDAVVQATEEASDYHFKVQTEADQKALDKLIAEGVKVNEVNDLNEFRQKCLDFRNEFVKKKGPEAEKFYKKILAIK
jgi:tripartite ATP-independent transporter DctP family solute receptor